MHHPINDFILSYLSHSVNALLETRHACAPSHTRTRQQITRTLAKKAHSPTQAHSIVFIHNEFSFDRFCSFIILVAYGSNSRLAATIKLQSQLNQPPPRKSELAIQYFIFLSLLIPEVIFNHLWYKKVS